MSTSYITLPYILPATGFRTYGFSFAWVKPLMRRVIRRVHKVTPKSTLQHVEVRGKFNKVVILPWKDQFQVYMMPRDGSKRRIMVGTYRNLTSARHDAAEILAARDRLGKKGWSL